MIIGDVRNVNEGHRLFEVSPSVYARSYYQVRICTQPSCSCPDFTRHGSKIFCKHILFVLLFGLDISDVDVLDQRLLLVVFQADHIDEILRKTDVDPQFRKMKNKKGKNLGTTRLKQIINSHENANEDHIFTLQFKEGPSAKCNGFNCKKILQIGTRCIKVDGALTVPFAKDYALKQLYYFCPKINYFNTPPVWSNVRQPVNIVKGSKRYY